MEYDSVYLSSWFCRSMHRSNSRLSPRVWSVHRSHRVWSVHRSTKPTRKIHTVIFHTVVIFRFYFCLKTLRLTIFVKTFNEYFFHHSWLRWWTSPICNWSYGFALRAYFVNFFIARQIFINQYFVYCASQKQVQTNARQCNFYLLPNQNQTRLDHKNF